MLLISVHFRLFSVYVNFRLVTRPQPAKSGLRACAVSFPMPHIYLINSSNEPALVYIIISCLDRFIMHIRKLAFVLNIWFIEEDVP